MLECRCIFNTWQNKGNLVAQSSRACKMVVSCKSFMALKLSLVSFCLSYTEIVIRKSIGGDNDHKKENIFSDSSHVINCIEHICCSD